MGWHLFDRIRSLARAGNIYQQERLFQDQSSLSRIMAGGELLDFSQQQALLDQTNLQINRLERYKDYDQMDEMGEISLALDLYADETSLVDPERKHTLIIKAESKTVKEELERVFFDQLLIDSIVRPMVRYLCKYGDAPFEIVPTVNRDGIASLRFINVYNFTRVETKHGDLVGFFHQDEIIEKPEFLHPWQVMHLRLTDYGNIYHPYGRGVIEGSRKAFKQLRLMEDAALIYRICLRWDTPVWTPNGYKLIKDLIVGDEVYCYNSDGKLEKTKVKKHYCNGKDRIIRIASRHREIFCNPTHPILTEFDIKGQTVQAYVDARDIIPHKHRLILPSIDNNNDYVALSKPNVPKYIRISEPIVDAKYKPSYIGVKVGLKVSSVESFLNGEHDLIEGRANCLLDFINKRDHKHEIINGWKYDCQTGTAVDYNIPEVADEDFARWFGFMVGDGYVSQRNNHKSVISQVGFACGDNDETNQKYKVLFEKLVGELSFHSDSKRHGTYYVYSMHFAEFMKINGFIPGSKNKRIPDWVYRSPRSVQEAFIDGYVDADGHNQITDGGVTTGYEIECCNHDLLLDLKELIHQIGWNVGNLRFRKREPHIIDNETGRIVDSPDGSWSLYFTKVESNRSENVLAVEEVESDEVYDITVESEFHNFIASGIPVSNTRAPEKRIFKIPIGNIPAKDVPEFMQSIARIFKNQRFYDPRTGQFNERFSPLIQEDDFFLPVRPDGTAPDISTLKGAENLDQIADIEYFKKKMIAPTKIPFKRVGIGDGAGDEQEKSLSSSDSQFSKAVQWIQREVSIGLTKVAICHLAMAGYSIDDLKNFEISMSASSAIEELYRIETWQGRTSVMSDLKDLGWFPKEWIVTRFTDLSPDEIEQLEELMSKEPGLDDDIEGLGGMGGMGGLGDIGGMDDIEGLPDSPDELDALAGPDEAEAGGLGDALGGVPGGAPDIGGLGEFIDKKHRNIINEDNKHRSKLAVARLINKISNENKLRQRSYSYFLNNNELDGLCKGKSKEVLVESNISNDDRTDATKQFYNILISE